jgi:hypothetical protein
MKLTKTKLKQIIKEELNKVLNEIGEKPVEELLYDLIDEIDVEAERWGAPVSLKKAVEQEDPSGITVDFKYSINPDAAGEIHPETTMEFDELVLVRTEEDVEELRETAVQAINTYIPEDKDWD